MAGSWAARTGESSAAVKEDRGRSPRARRKLRAVESGALLLPGWRFLFLSTVLSGVKLSSEAHTQLLKLRLIILSTRVDAL